MSEQHTPEPWAIDPYSDCDTIAIHSPAKDEHVCILQVDADYPDALAEANARRIVASVNATAGIPTATLEAMGEGGMAKLMQSVEEYRTTGDPMAIHRAWKLTKPPEPDHA